MRRKTPEQVRDLLIRKEWDPSTVFYDGAKDCRTIDAALIRDSQPLLRSHPAGGKDVRALVEAVSTAEPDEVVEAAWRAAIDALRALQRTSPKGTPRERKLLLGIARHRTVVRAMIVAAASEPDLDPSWLAVLSAEGSPESLALVRRHAAGLAKYPDLDAAIRSFEGALQSVSNSSTAVGTTNPNPPLPIRVSGDAFTRAHFWALIDGASGATDPVGTLRRWLVAMKPKQIAAFDRHFSAAMTRAYRHDLWGAAFLLLGGCSDDSFLDFRAALLLRGKSVFDRVLENPDALADHTDVQGDESIATLAAEVYEEKTGRELPIGRAVSIVPAPHGHPVAVDSRDALRQGYPRLFALVITP